MNHRWIVTARDHILNLSFFLNKAMQHVIECRIGRQAILIGLIFSQLCRRCFVDDALGNDFALSAKANMANMGVTPTRQTINLHLIKVFQGIIAATHIPIKRGIADCHFAFVPSRQNHVAKLVG